MKAGLDSVVSPDGCEPASEPPTLSLNALIKGYEPTLRGLLGYDIELDLFLDVHAGAIRADPGQIKRVLTNLVLNAREAMPAGGRLKIATARRLVDERFARSLLHAAPGPYVVLAVVDTGMGMTEKVKSHLFQPFFSTKERGKGRGLGLSTVCEIVVQQSQGAILVSSQPGQGTAFSLFFPRVAPTGKNGSTAGDHASKLDPSE